MMNNNRASAPAGVGAQKRLTQTVTPEKARFLFADSNQAFLDRIKADPRAAKFPPLLVAEGKQAVAELSNPQNIFNAIYLSTNLKNPDIFTVSKVAKQKHASVPIFLICNEEEELDGIDLKKYNCVGAIKRSATYSDILKEFLPPSILLDVNEIFQRSKNNNDPIGQQVEKTEEQFVPLEAAKFLTGSKTFFDLYIKIDEHKFVKILKSGDEFSQDRIQNFTKKGVTHFYIRSEDHEDFLALNEKLLSSIINNPKAPNQMKLVQGFNLGNHTMDLLKKSPLLEEKHVRFAEEFIQNVWNLIKNLDLSNSSATAKAFLDESLNNDHSIAVTMISSLLGKELGFKTDKSVKIIGLSAFFHDIGLFATPELYHEDVQQMNDEQKRAFYSHPVRGAKLVSQMKGIDPVVIQTIENHHKRRDGSGFPNKAHSNNHVPVTAEIIGISEEYLRFIQKFDYTQMPIEKYLVNLDSRVFSGFSQEVIEALKTVIKYNQLKEKKSA